MKCTDMEVGTSTYYVVKDKKTGRYSSGGHTYPLFSVFKNAQLYLGTGPARAAVNKFRKRAKWMKAIFERMNVNPDSLVVVAVELTVDAKEIGEV